MQSNILILLDTIVTMAAKNAIFDVTLMLF